MIFEYFDRQYGHSAKQARKISRDYGDNSSQVLAGTITAFVHQLCEIEHPDQVRKFLTWTMQHYPPQLTRPTVVVDNTKQGAA